MTIFLPKEIIFKIFQLLPLDDRLQMSLVCKSWYDISRMPSLWKNVKVFVPEDDILQFCEYIRNFPLVESFRLQIFWKDNYYFRNEKPYLKPHLEEALYNIILTWPNLKCLCLGQEMPMIILPSGLSHITYLPANPPYHNYDRVKDEHIYAIGNQNHIDEIRICHVHLAKYTNDSVKYLLQKKSSVLKCLSIDCYLLKNDSLSLIGTCTNLIKLSLSSCNNMEEYSLAAISHLKHLKYLNLEEICNFSSKMFNVLSFNTFSALVYLLLSSCESISKECFELMAEKMPLLVTFGLNSCKVTSQDLLKFLTDSKLIDNIALDVCAVDFEALLEELAKLNAKRSFKSICICDIGYAFENEGYHRYQEYIKNNFTCTNCIFEFPNPYFICKCF